MKPPAGYQRRCPRLPCSDGSHDLYGIGQGGASEGDDEVEATAFAGDSFGEPAGVFQAEPSLVFPGWIAAQFLHQRGRDPDAGNATAGQGFGRLMAQKGQKAGEEAESKRVQTVPKPAPILDRKDRLGEDKLGSGLLLLFQPLEMGGFCAGHRATGAKVRRFSNRLVGHGPPLAKRSDEPKQLDGTFQVGHPSGQTSERTQGGRIARER